MNLDFQLLKNISENYSEITERLTKKYNNDYWNDSVHDSFSEYVSEIRNIDAQLKQLVHETNNSVTELENLNIDNTLEKVDKLCGEITNL